MEEFIMVVHNKDCVQLRITITIDSYYVIGY